MEPKRLTFSCCLKQMTKFTQSGRIQWLEFTHTSRMVVYIRQISTKITQINPVTPRLSSRKQLWRDLLHAAIQSVFVFVQNVCYFTFCLSISRSYFTEGLLGLIYRERTLSCHTPVTQAVGFLRSFNLVASHGKQRILGTHTLTG